MNESGTDADDLVRSRAAAADRDTPKSSPVATVRASGTIEQITGEVAEPETLA
ncbi:MAG: hypothetical protein JO189_29545 [Deltaproteobacteria bacterium]|nr:hypothetical protein [Deltaproteobacteria bacterium]